MMTIPRINWLNCDKTMGAPAFHVYIPDLRQPMASSSTLTRLSSDLVLEPKLRRFGRVTRSMTVLLLAARGINLDHEPPANWTRHQPRLNLIVVNTTKGACQFV